jgi:hypothetical protein
MTNIDTQLQEIVFRRRNTLIQIKGRMNISSKDQIDFVKKLADYGYFIDAYNIEDVINPQEILNFFHSYCKINKMKNKPFYINFPVQVKELSEIELYLNAILHYWLGSRNNANKIERPVLEGNYPLKKINVMHNYVLISKLLDDILLSLLQQKSSFSQTDKEDIQILIPIVKKNNVLYDNEIEKNISIKENLFFYFNQLSIEDLKNKKEYFKTPTDILRYLAGRYNHSNTNLQDDIMFTSIERPIRLFIMQTLNTMNNKEEDIIKYKKLWKVLARYIHPFEKRYAKYITAIHLFKIAIDDIKIETFNSKKEKYFKNRNMKVISLLTNRPSEYARSLFRLLKIFNNTIIINNFKDRVINKVPTNVLLSIINKIKSYSNYNMYVPATKNFKFYVKPNTNNFDSYNYESFNIIESIIIKELRNRFSKKEKLGKVYMSENLKNFNIPYQMRSTSKSDKVIARFSKFDIPKNKSIIRTFIHWKNLPTLRIDVDSSFAILDENGHVLDHCSYTRIKSYYGTMIHSGDITDAPNGATEYIDLHIEKTIERIPEARYVLMSVYSYTGQKMKDIPECFAGWMLRENEESGEIYEPKTVENKFYFHNDGTSVIPLCIDLLERKIICLDINTKATGIGKNIERDNHRLSYLIKGLPGKMNYMNLYELFELHKDRYEIVNKPEDADIVFDDLSVEEILTNYI